MDAKCGLSVLDWGLYSDGGGQQRRGQVDGGAGHQGRLSPSSLDGSQGAKISSSKATYIIDKLLGEGGFGAVFRVRDEKNEKNEYAMKVEKKVETRRHSKLKMEVCEREEEEGEGVQVHILKLLTEKEKRKEKSHFTKIVDRGKKEMYFFLIMQLVGPSLADLKARRPEKARVSARRE